MASLLGPAGGGLTVDVGEAGEVLSVLVVGGAAGGERRVDFSASAVARRVHGRGGVAAVGRRQLGPARGYGRGVQPGRATHQTGLHA